MVQYTQVYKFSVHGWFLNADLWMIVYFTLEEVIDLF